MAYGCYNRPPFELYHRLWERDYTTAKFLPVTIPNVMAKTCQYQKDDKYADVGCVGCIHKEVKNEN